MQAANCNEARNKRDQNLVQNKLTGQTDRYTAGKDCSRVIFKINIRRSRSVERSGVEWRWQCGTAEVLGQPFACHKSASDCLRRKSNQSQV